MSIAKTNHSTPVVLVRALVPVLILAAGAGGFWAISHGLRQEPQLSTERATIPEAIVELVRRHDGGLTIEADGVVVPYREIDISAEVSGRIVERSEKCRAGRYVQQGELLLVIDPQDYQLEVDRLTEEQQQADVALAEWREQMRGLERLLKIAAQELELRERELARLQAAERTAFSLSDLERTEGSKLTAENALETLRNRSQLLQVGESRLESALKLTGLRLKKAKLDLERTRVVAPVDGVVIGDFIEQDAFVQAGTPLLTLEDTAKAEVKCKLPMEDLYWIWDSQSSGVEADGSGPSDSLDEGADERASQAYDIPDVEVEILYRLAGHGGVAYAWRGRLERYDGLGLDDKTRTVPCRVVVEHPRQRTPVDRSGPPALLRGMYVSIRIHVHPRTPLMAIPENAIRPGDQVWCVRDGQLAILPVQFVNEIASTASESTTGKLALVYVDATREDHQLPPLHAGDQVVTSALQYVRTGMAVQVGPSSAREDSGS